MHRREGRLAEIKAELSEARQQHPKIDEAAIGRTCGDLIGRFRQLLLGEVPLARQVLRKLLDGQPLRVSPVTVDGRKTLKFEGSTFLGPLAEPVYKGMATPRGFEPRLPP